MSSFPYPRTPPDGNLSERHRVCGRGNGTASILGKFPSSLPSFASVIICLEVRVVRAAAGFALSELQRFFGGRLPGPPLVELAPAQAITWVAFSPGKGGRVESLGLRRLVAAFPPEACRRDPPYDGPLRATMATRGRRSATSRRREKAATSRRSPSPDARSLRCPGFRGGRRHGARLGERTRRRHR